MTIDYRKKYLKYKIKYLEIVKKTAQKMKGGELSPNRRILDKIMGTMKIDNKEFCEVNKKYYKIL